MAVRSGPPHCAKNTGLRTALRSIMASKRAEQGTGRRGNFVHSTPPPPPESYFGDEIEEMKSTSDFLTCAEHKEILFKQILQQ
jgi:hypothetical protein